MSLDRKVLGFAHEPLTFPPRYYLRDGVIRLLRDDVPPELEPEELDRSILTVPPPIGATEATSLWTLAMIIIGLGAIILMVI